MIDAYGHPIDEYRRIGIVLDEAVRNHDHAAALAAAQGWGRQFPNRPMLADLDIGADLSAEKSLLLARRYFRHPILDDSPQQVDVGVRKAQQRAGGHAACARLVEFRGETVSVPEHQHDAIVARRLMV
ncbi:MAG: hypothetical protein LBF61_11730 [Azoarcus sp.]|jgi:hypothetical protein|nr:hypothetical protein [Azoarcus sp.]